MLVESLLHTSAEDERVVAVARAHHVLEYGREASHDVRRSHGQRLELGLEAAARQMGGKMPGLGGGGMGLPPGLSGFGKKK